MQSTFGHTREINLYAVAEAERGCQGGDNVGDWQYIASVLTRARVNKQAEHFNNG